MESCQIKINLPCFRLSQHSIKVIEQNLMLILLGYGYSISFHQFSKEVLPLPRPGLFVKEGCVCITLFKVTNPRAEASNCSFQGSINNVVSVYISATLHQLIVLGGPGLSLGDEEYVRPVQVET